MFKVLGFDNTSVFVAKTSADPTNEIGKIVYFPSNQGYALIVGNDPLRTPRSIGAVVKDDNLSELNQFMLVEEHRTPYNCKWIFHQHQGELLPGYPMQLPVLLSDAEIMQPTTPFDHLVKFYAPMAVDSNIMDKHVNFLLSMNMPNLGMYVYAFVLNSLQHALKLQNVYAINFIDSLLNNQQVFGLIQKFLNENPVAGRVTSVAEGLIHASEYEMPGIGDLFKFDTKDGKLYCNVNGLNFTFSNLEVGENLIWMMRRAIITKQITYKPLATLPANSQKAEISIRSYPDYGTRPQKITSEDVNIMFPGEAVVGSYSGHTIHFDINTFIQRSCGVFGKSGTGKSTFTRLVAGQLVRGGQTIMVMDEHNEFAKTHMAYGKPMYGLQDVFPEKVRTVSFGTPIFSTPDGKQHQSDICIQIPLELITAEDLLQVGQSLNLSKGAAKVLSAVNRKMQNEWKDKYNCLIDALLFMKGNDYKVLIGESYDDTEAISDDETSSIVVAEGSLIAVRSSLAKFFLKDDKHYFDYYTKKPVASMKNSVNEIIAWLKNGQSVIVNTVERGYILIANLIFRLVMDEWQKNPSRHLTIFIEEAHRLIPPNNETLVGKVAREMRKYETTLVIIDQTPDKIDSEVVRQLGTYCVFPLASIEEGKCALPQGTPVQEIMSRLGAAKEAYLWGSTFLLPVFVQIEDYSKFMEGVMADNSKKKQPADTSLSKFYKGDVSL